VARAGVDQDDVRRVYANEGPNAYRVAATQIRADALAALATTDATADIQREIATQSAFALRSAAQPGTLLGERQYDLEGGRPDLARRLGDVRAAHAPPADPDDADREGDGFARLAFVTAIVTAVVTGLSAVGACVRRRRSATKEPLEFVPQPALATAAQKRASYILLIIWVAGVLIPLVQLMYSSEEQRYQADAARHSVQARSDESISRTRTEFVDTALQIAMEGSVAATAGEISAAYQSAAVAAAASRLARAEEAAADRSAVVAQEMARVPLDAALARALTTRQYDWDNLNALSTWETRKADSASLISNILLALIAVVALIGPAVEYRLKGREEAAEAALAEAPPAEPPDAEVPALVAPAPAAGHRFLAGLVTGSAFGMSAVWWLGRRRRRSRCDRGYHTLVKIPPRCPRANNRKTAKHDGRDVVAISWRPCRLPPARLQDPDRHPGHL
jgi:hypothetical protein